MIMEPYITYDLNALRASLDHYSQLCSLTESEALAKQSAKLGKYIHDGLALLKPDKGSIREERLQALAEGSGVKVRPAVYDKLHEKLGSEFSSLEQRYAGPNNELKGSGYSARRTMNFQALAVQAELGLRESGRGFMAHTTPRRSFAELEAIGNASGIIQNYDRYSRMLSLLQFDLSAEAAYKHVTIRWPANAPGTEGMNQEQQMAVIDGAIRLTTADIEDYISSKLNDVKYHSGL
jgi:hypothetical protein